jgi:hypothetical protein
LDIGGDVHKDQRKHENYLNWHNDAPQPVHYKGAKVVRKWQYSGLQDRLDEGVTSSDSVYASLHHGRKIIKVFWWL